MKNQIEIIGKDVIGLQIKALQKLKNSIDKSFRDAVNAIFKCKSKVIFCGVGKSGKIASKISSTFSSTGTPSFSISANDCSHGDLGVITPNDILILISQSGNTEELKNIIKFSKLNKIFLIGIVSNINSYLYNKSNIQLLIPNVKEAGQGIVPTSSTTAQLSLGDALAIALMTKRKFGKLDFKRYHPSGNLGNKLKTADDIMLTNEKIPFIDENEIMRKAITVLNSKKLGFLVLIDQSKEIKGVFTDGDLKRLIQKKREFKNLKIKNFASKKPFLVEKNTLISEILTQMNRKKITNVCVYSKKNKKKIIGVIHIHNILSSIQ